MQIKSYFDERDDINLTNTQYVRPTKNDDGSWTNGVLYLTYRDNKTGEKKVKAIENPETETFITKQEHRSDFKTQRLFLDKERVDSHIVQYNKLTRFISNEIKRDGVDLEYLKIAETAPKEVFKWRHSYFADYDLNDYAIMAYALSNLNNGSVSSTKVSTSYLDIESDIYGLTETEINEGQAPMSAVSVVIPYDAKGEKYKHPKVFTLLLRNHLRYKGYKKEFGQEYFEEHMDEFIEECHEEFDKKYDTPEFIIKIYDDEIIMFKNLFALLHASRPDFILIWNMSYDVPTMITRLRYLGENPVNYFCNRDFPTPYYRYNYDNIYKNDFKNKTESFECTCYSQWSDQMLNYAGIRKSKREYGGNSLDNVSKIELRAQKRRFDNPNTNVTNAALEEYWNFVKYSINDVLLQYGIDKKTEDTQALFEQAIYGGTRVYKALKQSVYLKNVFAIEYFKRDIVPRNNNNVNYATSRNEESATDEEYNDQFFSDPDGIKLAGALVGDPTLNTHMGINMYGKPSNHLYEYVIDFDFKSMYPNLKITTNMAEHTQYGRLLIDEQILENENPMNDEKFMRAGKFIEDFETDDAIIIGSWMKLPTMIDLINGYDAKYHSKEKENDVSQSILEDEKYIKSLERDDDGRIIIHSRKRVVMV